MFDINQFKNITEYSNQLAKRLSYLKSINFETKQIEETIDIAYENINSGSNSFVIYGEPQSGKTEMMIALTAKLLDANFKIIVILVQDNVRLLTQNLDRFRKSGLAPAPVDISEIQMEEIGEKKWIIFCKKNNRNLKDLIEKLRNKKNKVVIDDEADYATPNSKINKGELSAINQSVYELLDIDNGGRYIGVTATPARLDLNNTFNNLTEKWVEFKPHGKYMGKDVFFPINKGGIWKGLQLMPEQGDDPKYIRDALLSFLVNVALLNLDNPKPKNYAMLVHTSGKKAEHTKDYKDIIKIFDVLSNQENKNFEKYVKELFEIANLRERQPDEIVKYILRNIQNKRPVVLNSDNERLSDPTDPDALFTIIVGGNILSRGITFNNLLTMFFTRDVKHKLQQDTYIQRARMFGNRGDYIIFFELWIPEKLYLDWHRCFVFHQLALNTIKSTEQAPIWLADRRIQPASTASIDKTTLDIDNGEMAFKIFDFNTEIEKAIEDIKNPYEALTKINNITNAEVIPLYLLDFIRHYSTNLSDICIHGIRIPNFGPDSNYNNETLLRDRGIFGGSEINDHLDAIHHIMIVKNPTTNKARFIYKHAGNIKFIKKLIKE